LKGLGRDQISELAGKAKIRRRGFKGRGRILRTKSGREDHKNLARKNTSTRSQKSLTKNLSGGSHTAIFGKAHRGSMDLKKSSCRGGASRGGQEGRGGKIKPPNGRGGATSVHN